MTDKERILAEVERCESICDDYIAKHIDTISIGIANAKKVMCQQIKAFIKGMQEEPVREDLKEKAKQLGRKYFPDESNIWARANVEAEYIESACIEMANWKEQQILEKSFEARVCKCVGIYLKEMDRHAIEDTLKDFADGDIVRVVIIK